MDEVDADGNSAGPPLSDEVVARRAFEISLTDASGSPDENWARAEEELRRELDAG
jgi:hypothetical protein